MAKKRLLILFGGNSPEYLISVKSALYLLENITSVKLDVSGKFISADGSSGSREELVKTIDLLAAKRIREKKKTDGDLIERCFKKTGLLSHGRFIPDGGIDAVFPMMPGRIGEDGSIQGLFRYLDIPWIGCSVAASALCMDKAHTKRVLRSHGIPVTDFIDITKNKWISDRQGVFDTVSQRLKAPFFIKPARLGSSIGVLFCEDLNAIMDRIHGLFTLDSKVLIESAVDEYEYAVGAIGNDVPRTSAVARVGLDRNSFDFDAKYGPAAIDDIIPAPLGEEETRNLKNLAAEVYSLLELNGMARIDFFGAGDGFSVNEINTIPAFGGTSLFNRMWEAAGIDLNRLMEELTDYAIEFIEKEKRNENFRT